MSQRINIKAKNDLSVDEDFIFAMENEIGDEKKVFKDKGGTVERNIPDVAKSEKPSSILDEVPAGEIIAEKGQVLESSISETEDENLEGSPAAKEAKSSNMLAGKAFQHLSIA